MRLELLQGLLGVVDQSEAGALATTVLCAETEDGDLVLVGLVQVGQLLTELILGDVGAVGVEDVPGNTEMSVVRFFQCDFFSLRETRPWCWRPHRCLRLCVCVCVCVFRFHPQSPIVQFLVHRGKGKGGAYTTICLRASRGLRMNLRVRRVTGVSAILVVSGDAGMERVWMSTFNFRAVRSATVGASPFGKG